METKTVNGAAEWSDSAPAYAVSVAELYRWSLNRDGATPFRKFLDLTGYSEEHYGQSVASDWSAAPWGSLGFVELDLLGRALVEYSDRPQDVDDWVTDLLRIESEFGA